MFGKINCAHESVLFCPFPEPIPAAGITWLPPLNEQRLHRAVLAVRLGTDPQFLAPFRATAVAVVVPQHEG